MAEILNYNAAAAQQETKDARAQKTIEYTNAILELIAANAKAGKDSVTLPKNFIPALYLADVKTNLGKGDKKLGYEITDETLTSGMIISWKNSIPESIED